MTVYTAPRQPDAPAGPLPTSHRRTRLLAAVLALGVGYVHVKDQGGFPGGKSPHYVGVGYYLLEAAALLTAVLLLTGTSRHTVKGWVLAAGVAVAPLIGFVLSRGPGLPNYTDDKGNWTEPIGIASIILESALLLLTTGLLVRSRAATR